MGKRIDDFLKDEGMGVLNKPKRRVRVLIELKSGIGIIPHHPMAPSSFHVDRVHNARGEEILGYCEEYRTRGEDPDFRISVTGGDQGYVYINQIKTLRVLGKGKVYYGD